MEKKYPIDDWSNYIPQMSNIQDRTGISIEWQKLWAEIEIWYGDIKKHETGEQFLKRMQATYFTPQGIGWVKGDTRLPEKYRYTIVRNLNTGKVKQAANLGHNKGWDVAMDSEFLWDNTEWLDEGQPQPVEDWISVNDQLPEIMEYVLVYNTEGATLIGRLMSNGWVAMFADGEILMSELTATHWRPLPEPPKKKP